MHFEPWQYALGVVAALLIGLTKTGVPGVGILMVPIMANVFGGRLSVGATLPLLIFADVFAVAYYHAHAEFSKLKQLGPWVFLGLIGGTVFLKVLGDAHDKRDLLNPVIGAIVLAMLAVSLLRGKMGDKIAPHSRVGTWMTGALAGFTTMVSNAAGPVMAIYFTSMGLTKYQFMGMSAWYFFIFNLTKVPFLVWLTLDNPAEPLLTAETLKFDLVMAPVVVLGALLGRKLLPVISQKAFDYTVLVLATLAAIKLIVG
ncbi:MAG TPA: sulfite exporter TauE/SafE family protein [Fimbriimonas sp.]|nr:sulfite exporter TauE/SafE family protein [Fimbriimonas sp.]